MYIDRCMCDSKYYIYNIIYDRDHDQCVPLCVRHPPNLFLFLFHHTQSVLFAQRLHGPAHFSEVNLTGAYN